MRKLPLGIALMLCATTSAVAEPPAAKRVQVTGEVVDTWCSVTGIMFSEGTAHHQCAVWCAVGGIPVSIKTADGAYYIVLKIGDDDASAAPDSTMVTIVSHQATVDGELHERDGVKYLFVSKVADDKGVVNMTHDEYGIVPFGN